MLQEKLREAGLMVTTPRLRVLELMGHRKHSHLTADAIHRELTSSFGEISLGTVYRVLAQLEKAGLVIRRQFEKGPACYELDHGDHHDHMLCVKCGKVIEFADKTVERHLNRIVEKNKAKFVDHSLVLRVFCKDCAKKN